MIDRNRVGTLMGQGDLTRDAKELISAGKSTLDIFFRGSFLDENEVNDFVAIARYCVDFDMLDELEMVKWSIAGRANIGGKARLEFLEAITGILLGEAHNIKDKRNIYRNNNNGKKQQQQTEQPAEV